VPLAAPIGAEAATGSPCLERDVADLAGEPGAGQGNYGAAVGGQGLAPRPTALDLPGGAAVARPGAPPELNTAVGAGDGGRDAQVSAEAAGGGGEGARETGHRPAVAPLCHANQRAP
jgi:hypothetical protein